MTVRSKAHAGNDLASLGQRRVHGKRIAVAVQIVDALGDGFALEILPRTVADAVARIDRRLTVGGLSAEIGAPGLSARAVALRQLQAKRIGAFQAAEIGALAGPVADDKECHVRRLRQLRRRRLRRRLLRFGGFEAKAQGIKMMLPHVDEFRPVHNLSSIEGLISALSSPLPPQHRSAIRPAA